ncbi:MAG TPA: hypothetical protein VIL72_03200 [Beijerinckiaceae bacterium]|jgi:hypothetical protein
MAVKLNQHDLEFILAQIKIAEAHADGTVVPARLEQAGHRLVGSAPQLATWQNVVVAAVDGSQAIGQMRLANEIGELALAKIDDWDAEYRLRKG